MAPLPTAAATMAATLGEVAMGSDLTMVTAAWSMESLRLRMYPGRGTGLGCCWCARTVLAGGNGRWVVTGGLGVLVRWWVGELPPDDVDPELLYIFILCLR